MKGINILEFFLEGNQYLISSNDNEVKIIDYVGIEHGLIDNSEIIFTLTDFVFFSKS